MAANESEKDKLEREIAYFSDLINVHKNQSLNLHNNQRTAPKSSISRNDSVISSQCVSHNYFINNRYSSTSNGYVSNNPSTDSFIKNTTNSAYRNSPAVASTFRIDKTVPVKACGNPSRTQTGQVNACRSGASVSLYNYRPCASNACKTSSTTTVTPPGYVKSVKSSIPASLVTSVGSTPAQAQTILHTNMKIVKNKSVNAKSLQTVPYKKTSAQVAKPQEDISSITKPLFCQPREQNLNLITSIINVAAERTSNDEKRDSSYKIDKRVFKTKVKHKFSVTNRHVNKSSIVAKRPVHLCLLSPSPSSSQSTIVIKTKNKLIKKRRTSTQLILAKHLLKTTINRLNNPHNNHQESSAKFKINRHSSPANQGSTRDGASLVNHILGRRITNLSKNKFKFVKAKSSPTNNARRGEVVMVTSKSRLTIDRRSLITSPLIMKKGRVVRCDRIVTRTSIRPKQPIKSLRTNNGQYSKTGKMKIDRRRSSSIRRDVTAVRGSDSQRRAYSVLQRSRQIALRATRKKVEKKYCTYYNRFGSCNRGTQCQYLHDKTKIAVCRRFLRGTCQIKDCLFSHVLSRDKMPVCGYFLRGVCVRDECPYGHVNVSTNANVCQDFIDGYCSKGDKCGERHTLVCQNFVKTGKCKHDIRCKLKHPRKRQHKNKVESTGTKRRECEEEGNKRRDHREEGSKRRDRREEDLGPGQMPSFIQLEPDMTPCDQPSQDLPHLNKLRPIGPQLQIRPFFGDN